MKHVLAAMVIAAGPTSVLAAQSLRRINPPGLSTPTTYRSRASTLVGVARLASLEYKVEIEATAVLP